MNDKEEKFVKDMLKIHNDHCYLDSWISFGDIVMYKSFREDCLKVLEGVLYDDAY